MSFLVLITVVSGNASFSAVNDQYDIQEATIESLHAAITQNKLSCLKIVEIYLHRISEYDQPTGLNAIVNINTSAIDLAKRLDRETQDQSREANDLRPLHCVPVIVKDNIETISMPTTGGSIVFKDYMSNRDAVMIQRLKQAGAIILAKSNMAEWAFSPYYTISSVAGETLNAYDLSRVPAGSSGGTASAVAANFGLVGIGTDTGNSVRGPASHLALVGLRPTQNLFDQTGIIPLLKNRDMAGPMTRTVMDAAKLLDVLVSGEGLPAKHYSTDLTQKALQGARIGVMRSISDTDTIDIDIEVLFEDAIKDLSSLGAEIIDPFKVNRFEELGKQVNFCSRFRYDFNNYLKSVVNKPPIQYLKDIVMTKKYHKKTQGGLKWAMSVDVEPKQQTIPCVGVEGDPRRKNYKEAVIEAMDKYQVDAVIYPSWNNPPRKLGDEQSPHGNNSPIIAPHTGQPAITVPMGFTSHGLPAGLQLLGRHFDEKKLLQYAYAYEQYTKHRRPPAMFEKNVSKKHK